MQNNVTVLYSGGDFDTRECAFHVAGKLTREGHVVLASNLEKYLASHILRERTLLMCMEADPGELPDETLDFLDFVRSLDRGDLNQLSYSLLTIGDAPGRSVASHTRELDSLLANMGGRRIVPRMDCRRAFENGLHVWAETICTFFQLKKALW